MTDKEDDYVYETEHSKVVMRSMTAEQKEAMNQTYTMVLKGISTTMVDNTQFPNDGLEMMSEHDRQNFLNRRGEITYALTALMMTGDFYDKDGNKLNVSWMGLEDAIVVVPRGSNEVMNMIANCLASLVDDDAVMMLMTIINGIVQSQLGFPSAVQQMTADAGLRNGISLRHLTEDGEETSVTPSADALNRIFEQDFEKGDD